ncbi:DHH family phosphoesterase [Rurimicrobium arvi]|uniref:Bifunctional oligoribonuclease/PAP phosphatase NrnA n=1 Tax=Rurimicrobium arvi TaxID=2049916 RepID=A0ABP8MR86_9BACT
MKPIQEVLPLLQQPRNIFITTHHKPDGDAIGSMMALTLFLEKMGHTVSPVSPSEVPDFLAWVPGLSKVLNHEAEPRKVEPAIAAADLIFCLDFNDFSRVKGMQTLLSSATQTKVLIDHHMFPKPDFDFGVSEPLKSSTCEMVYDFINLTGHNALIDEQIGACIYTGAMTDTGSFRFPACTASVHEMIADLMRKGLKHSVIHEEVYDSWEERRMRFLGFVLQERMEIFPEYSSGLITLSQEDLQKFDVRSGDTEGIVNYPMSIAGIRFATLIIERKDGIKLSFRSKGTFDVNAFARNHFNGGGHFNASGGQSSQSFSETILCFKRILSEFHPSKN